MLITNNVQKFNYSQALPYSKRPAKNGGYYKNSFSGPSFSGTNNIWNFLIEKLKPVKKSPTEKAAELMEKAFNLSIKETVKSFHRPLKPKENNYRIPFILCKKAAGILEANWNNLDSKGQKQYSEAIFSMSGICARTDIPKALGILREHLQNLNKKKILLNDKETLDSFLISAATFGKIAVLEGNIKEAKQCYEFGHDIAMLAEERGTDIMKANEKESMATYFVKKIAAADTIEE